MEAVTRLLGHSAGTVTVNGVQGQWSQHQVGTVVLHLICWLYT